MHVNVCNLVLHEKIIVSQDHARFGCGCQGDLIKGQLIGRWIVSFLHQRFYQIGREMLDTGILALIASGDKRGWQ